MDDPVYIEGLRARMIAGTAAHMDAMSWAYHRAVWRYVFTDTKSYRPTWEFRRDAAKGKAATVDAMFEEITGADSLEYALLYGATGTEIVHSSPLSLSRLFASIGRPQTFVLRAMPSHEMSTIALATSNSAMFLVIDSLTEYIGLDLTADGAAQGPIAGGPIFESIRKQRTGVTRPVTTSHHD